MTHSNQEFPFSEFIQAAKTSRYIVVDTEGYEYIPKHWKPMGFSIAFRWIGCIVSRWFTWDHPLIGCEVSDEEKEAVKDLIENHPCVVMHNAKHDIRDLDQLGIFIKENYRDTMLMVHDINENLMSKSLDFCSRHYGGQPKEQPKSMKDVKEKLGWQFVAISLLSEYCRHDAYITAGLFEKVEPQWEKENYPKLWKNRDAPFGQLVKSMEDWGIRIDSDLCRREIDRGELELARLIRELGYRNPASPRDMEKLLLDELKLPPFYNEKAKSDRPTFDKKAMEKYDEILKGLDNPTAKHILEYRGWSKTISSNYQAYLRYLDTDGRLRASFKLHGTVNDRMSCADPNLQQIPRVSDKDWNGHLKSAFVADEGFSLVEADYSNLEFRLAAIYAKEQGLLDIFNSGVDVFAAIAEELYWERQKVKTLIYMTMFGAGMAKIAREMGVSIEQATELKNMFFTRYSGMGKIIKEARTACLRRGRIELWSGRIRHFEDPIRESHKAFNALIQGGAAGIVKSSMLRLNKEGFNTPNCRMLLQIHDSVVFEIRDDLVSELVPCIEKVMSDVEPIFKSCKFPVKAKAWGSE